MNIHKRSRGLRHTFHAAFASLHRGKGLVDLVAGDWRVVVDRYVLTFFRMCYGREYQPFVSKKIFMVPPWMHTNQRGP